MKKILIGTAIFLSLLVVGVMIMDSVPAEAKKPDKSCTTIQSGELESSTGEVLTTGYDMWGYNYQAHMFNGGYCDAYRDAPWCQDYKDDYLLMKWNDAWLSNKDCDGDGKLDRHYGYDSYIGSGAWETNHQSGEYEMEGDVCKWSYFVKIVAAPDDAYKIPEDANGSSIPGDWYTADGKEMGYVIWGEFAVIQEVYNDPCGGYNGLLYKGEAPTGFGFYMPK